MNPCTQCAICPKCSSPRAQVEVPLVRHWTCGSRVDVSGRFYQTRWCREEVRIALLADVLPLARAASCAHAGVWVGGHGNGDACCKWAEIVTRIEAAEIRLNHDGTKDTTMDNTMLARAIADQLFTDDSGVRRELWLIDSDMQRNVDLNWNDAVQQIESRLDAATFAGEKLPPINPHATATHRIRLDDGAVNIELPFWVRSSGVEEVEQLFALVLKQLKRRAPDADAAIVGRERIVISENRGKA